MKSIITLFVRYPVLSNLLMFSIFVFGLIAMFSMKFAFFPEIPPNQIFIQVAYPGASPEEVEEGVVLKIEENVDGLEGVERVTSVSRENFGQVTIEILTDAELDKVLTDVKNAVDRINSFPVGAEKPVVFEQTFRRNAASVAIYGDADLVNMKYIVEDLRDRMLATDQISQVQVSGLPKLEFSVEVSESDLQRYNLTFSEISRAIAESNVNISGGKIETADEEILIRARGRNYHASELAHLVVRANPDGTVVRLGDVAELKERWEDVPDRTRYNQRTAVVLNVQKTRSEDIIDIVDEVENLVSDFNATNPVVVAEVIDDQTIGLRQRIDLLMSNGLYGLVFVIIALSFFMNLRIAGWVSVGIPFSFAGMFIVAFLSGITINVISTFGMIIVIGILVDDAIVVGENIYAKFEKGLPPFRAAVEGTMEVIGPVTTSILTTVLAFMPFFFLDGFLGKFIWHMALVVIASLMFSLVEAFFILPGHLAHSKGLRPHNQDGKVRKAIEKFIDFVTNRIYGPTLDFAITWRYSMVVAPIGLFIVTIALLGTGVIRATFFPFIDGDNLPVNISLVEGRQERDTDSILTLIENAAWKLNEELKAERADGKDIVIGARLDVGSNDFGETGSHTGKLDLLLLDGEQRDMESMAIAGRLRAAVGPLSGVQNISFGRTSFFGKPISVSLLGTNPAELNLARNKLKTALEKMPELKDVTETGRDGRREIDITLKPRAHALGLTLRDVAGQVRQGFFGEEVQRIQRGRDEIRVWVRYNNTDRASLGFIDRMRIRTADGAEYPFSELATYSLERGLSQINRLNRMREVKVEAALADINDDLPPILAKVSGQIVPEILKSTPGVRASFEGQSRDRNKQFASMQRAFPLAFVGIFLIIVVVFRSAWQALLVMSLIPFGILGAIWGHHVAGIQLNILSIYGVIALSGIIVNDSIVLIDKINRNLREGMRVRDAVRDAGLARLRPILLTTLTTALGLAPIIMEKSRQAQFLIPMAVSVAYGLIFGTLILLVMLPAGFVILNEFRFGVSRFWNWVYNGRTPTPESVEPAAREIASYESMEREINGKELAAAHADGASGGKSSNSNSGSVSGGHWSDDLDEEGQK